MKPNSSSDLIVKDGKMDVDNLPAEISKVDAQAASSLKVLENEAVCTKQDIVEDEAMLKSKREILSITLIGHAQEQSWGKVLEIMRMKTTTLSTIPESYAVGYVLLEASQNNQWDVVTSIVRNSRRFGKWPDVDSIKLSIHEAICAGKESVVLEIFDNYMKLLLAGSSPPIVNIASYSLKEAAALYKWSLCCALLDLQVDYKFWCTANSIEFVLEKAARYGITQLVYKLFVIEQNVCEIFAHPEYLKRALRYAEEYGHIDTYNYLCKISGQRDGKIKPPAAPKVNEDRTSLVPRRQAAVTSTSSLTALSPTFFANADVKKSLEESLDIKSEKKC